MQLMTEVTAPDRGDLAELVAEDGSWQRRRMFYDVDVYEAERQRIFHAAGCS